MVVFMAAVYEKKCGKGHMSLPVLFLLGHGLGRYHATFNI